jgi:hypothetical protein
MSNYCVSLTLLVYGLTAERVIFVTLCALWDGRGSSRHDAVWFDCVTRSVDNVCYGCSSMPIRGEKQMLRLCHEPRAAGTAAGNTESCEAYKWRHK